MKKILTIKNTFIFLIVLIVATIILEQTGNEYIMDKIVYLFLVAPILLLIAFIFERKDIQARQEKIKKTIDKKEDKIILLKSDKNHKIFLIMMLFAGLLSPVLKNTFPGFIISYGGMLLGVFLSFNLIKRWTKGQPFKKTILAVAIILVLMLLMLNVTFYPEQFETYQEVRNFENLN